MDEVSIRGQACTTRQWLREQQSALDCGIHDERMMWNDNKRGTYRWSIADFKRQRDWIAAVRYRMQSVAMGNA